VLVQTRAASQSGDAVPSPAPRPIGKRYGALEAAATEKFLTFPSDKARRRVLVLDAENGATWSARSLRRPVLAVRSQIRPRSMRGRSAHFSG